MFSIRSRRDLSLLLERQMTAASARLSSPSIEEDIENRTALKTYLIEAHGALRKETFTALEALCSPLGVTVEPCDEPELFELSIGELQSWLDTSDRRVFRLYTVGAAKDADRLHEILVSASGELECVWLPPRALENLARAAESRMVLFSLRHDRRPLRRAPDTEGIDSVTLRFWGPRARETLDKLRHSDVLPASTSVYSVRVRVGDDSRYCLAEVFHTGKITAVGTSFTEHQAIVRSLLDEHEKLIDGLESARRTPRRVCIPLRWNLDDLAFAVSRMFSGAEPFRLWAIPEVVSDDRFVVHAVDLDVGRTAVFELDRDGVSFSLSPNTPASVAIRFASALQYHVDADLRDDVLSPDPLLQLALPTTTDSGPFDEKSSIAEVARAVLPAVCASWVRGTQSVTTTAVLQDTHGTENFSVGLDGLVHRVLTEAAAHEWRQWLKFYTSTDSSRGGTWRFESPLPFERNARLRELTRLNRAAQSLVVRLAGVGLARWLQLSLFSPESLVTPITDD